MLTCASILVGQPTHPCIVRCEQMRHIPMGHQRSTSCFYIVAFVIIVILHLNARIFSHTDANNTCDAARQQFFFIIIQISDVRTSHTETTIILAIPANHFAFYRAQHEESAKQTLRII